MKKKALLNMLTALVIGGFVMMSCDKTPGPGKAEVKVIDKDGQIQKKVKVVMFCTEPECVVKREGLTNDLGIYTQEFDLPVVLRVRAVRYDTTITKTGLPPNVITKVTQDSVCGEGFIQVENDEIANETVTILTCK